MGISLSLLLGAIGAVLLFAVTGDVEGVDFDTIGIILMIVAGIGLLWSIFLTASYREDTVVRRGRRPRDDV